MTAALASTLLFATSEPARLPPAATARLLLVVLAVALLGILALVVVTVIRYVWSRNEAARQRRQTPPAPKALNAWEQAGRRAPAEPILPPDDPTTPPASPPPPEPDS